MTISFNDLAVPPVRPFVLRGKEFPLRFVSAADLAVVEAAFPMPEPPTVPDRTKGTNAPRVPDFTDLAYMEGRDTQYRTWVRARVVIGARYTTEHGLAWSEGVGPADHASNVAYLRAAVPEMTARLTPHEMTALREAMDGFTPASLVADALKN